MIRSSLGSKVSADSGTRLALSLWPFQERKQSRGSDLAQSDQWHPKCRSLALLQATQKMWRCNEIMSILVSQDFQVRSKWLVIIALIGVLGYRFSGPVRQS